jgi:hypothetical protein
LHDARAAKPTGKLKLGSSLQDIGLDKYKEYQRLADQGWMRLRISETNSL